MGKCPFWSTKKEVVKCYNDCPMYEDKLEDELCPFKEISFNNEDVKSEDKYNYSDLINEESIYDLTSKN